MLPKMALYFICTVLFMLIFITLIFFGLALSTGEFSLVVVILGSGAIFTVMFAARFLMYTAEELYEWRTRIPDDFGGYGE